MYVLSRDNLGQVVAINRQSDGATLPFNPKNQTFVEGNFLTQELRKWEKDNEPLDLSDAPDLEAIRATKIEDAIAKAKEATEGLVSNYSSAEQASWNEKVAQAKAYLASGDINDTPYLKIEAEAIAGSKAPKKVAIALDELANKIVNKSQELHQAVALITGERTKIIKKIEEAKTLEALLTIS